MKQELKTWNMGKTKSGRKKRKTSAEMLLSEATDGKNVALFVFGITIVALSVVLILFFAGILD
jgi:hypothetical protein